MNSTAADPETGRRRVGTSRADSEHFQTIIRLDPACRLIPQMSVDAFRNIQGVHEVHMDAACKTVRIIFDGMQETIGRLANYLCSCERKPRCGEPTPCNRPIRAFEF
jgi:hypothetical protein